MKLILILSTLVVFALCQKTPGPIPILEVHGFEGTRIRAHFAADADKNSKATCHKEKNITIFGSAKYLNEHLTSWFQPLTLAYNSTTRLTSDPPGIATSVYPFGNTASIDYLDEERCLMTYFIYLNRKLKKKGYKVSAAPYDFRKAINEQDAYFEKLKKWIEKTKNETGKPTILIIHSMGGTMIHHFLRYQSQKWKDEHIACLIKIASALGGGPNIIKSWFKGQLLPGTDPSIKPLPVCAASLNCYLVSDNKSYFVIPPKTIRSWSSTSQLLPSPTVWGGSSVIVKTDTKNYTVKDIPEFLKDFGLHTISEIYKNNFENATNIDPPGVDCHCMFGNSIPTPRLIIIKGKPTFPEISMKHGKGDGLVNFVDKKVCKNWIGKGKKNVTVKYFKLNHDELMAVPESLNYITQIIDDYNNKNNF